MPQGRRRAIVLVTDGGETTSVSKFEDTRRAAIASGALLYSMIIRPVKNENGRNTAGEHALITITDSTGGARISSSSDANQIDSMFDRIDRELRTQYFWAITRSPTPPPGERPPRTSGSEKRLRGALSQGVLHAIGGAMTYPRARRT